MDRSLRRNRGFSIIEVMVGVVIAMIAILVIYQVFTVAEAFKRNTTSIGDAQQNGLLSSFMLGIQLSNAGSAVATSATDLGTCANPGTGIALKDFAATWRPIPVLIFDGGANATPDSFGVYYSLAPRLVAPALFTQAALAGADYLVQSPTGFKPGDLVVAVSQTGPCPSSKVTAVTAPDGNGIVTITHTGAAVNLTSSATLFNMGPASDVQKAFYDVSNGTLRSSGLIDDKGVPIVAPVPNPIASNIVNMKMQYGIDTDGDGLLDAWVPATGPWAPAVLLVAPIATINQIKAVRMGVIVRGEQFDQNYKQNVAWSMFDGAIAGSFAEPVAGKGNWRYRVYETIIPLRNEIWNKQT